MVKSNLSNLTVLNNLIILSTDITKQIKGGNDGDSGDNIIIVDTTVF